MYIIGIVLVMLLGGGAGFAQDPISEIQNPNQPSLSPPVNGGEARVVRAVRTASPKIDGIFDVEWLKAALADHFVQKRPVEGAPESLPTRVFVLYDNDALNVCFVCNDHPDSISARVLRRDNDDNCDVVYIALDSFHDRRNAYYFGLTAAGGQVDGTFSNESVTDGSWDGIWESAVGRTDSGWVAEMRIPFSSFRHGGARADGWGFQLERDVNRRQEETYWQPVSVQRGVRVGEFGILAGLENIGSARHLEVLPHAVARFDAPADSNWKSRSEWKDLGFYAKYVPAASWTVDFAYQPDFAQVDVDYEVIQLSDYPVFYPEKRPFFLEVNNFFDTAPISLLYTRRVTDPDFGGRIYGQSEKFRGMVLGGQNRNEHGIREYVTAGRAVLNLGKQHQLGLTGTSLYRPNAVPLGDAFRAYTGGLDARIRWGAENRWSLSAAGVKRDRVTIAGADKLNDQPFEFRNSLYLNLHPLPVKMSLTDNYRGQDYNINDLGWTDFSNTIEHYIWFGNNWQPGKMLVQQWGLDLNGWQRNLPDGTFPEGGGNVGTWFRTKENFEYGGGWQWGLLSRRNYETNDKYVVGEFRDNFFEDYGRFVLEPHYYQAGWAWFETDDRTWLTYLSEGTYGLFREGHKWSWNQAVTVKPRANLETTFASNWTQVWGVSDYDNYQPTTFRVWRWVTRYSPTLNLSLRGTLQWIEEDKQLLTNLLLAWNWHPGSWFYAVYDEGRMTNPLAYKTEGDRTVRVKATYFFTVK